MTATFYVGDAIEVMSKLPEKSVDLILTSPPFLALRSYLPQDHPDKKLEGGSQSTPGEYVDWLIDVVEACARVLAPHGSLCFELGDTYAGSGGAGGDYDPGGWREGQAAFEGSAYRHIDAKYEKVQRDDHEFSVRNLHGKKQGGGHGWPLAKSLSLIPESFRWAMVYGHNPFTGRRTEPWRLRNVIRWVRPNPPVGALGDKFRPATSELMVFCKTKDRYFDLDAVREPYAYPNQVRAALHTFKDAGNLGNNKGRERGGLGEFRAAESAGAPPLDWWNIPLLEGEEPTRYGPPPQSNTHRRNAKGVDQRENTVPSAQRSDANWSTLPISDDAHPLGSPPLDWWNIPPGGYPGAHYACVDETTEALTPDGWKSHKQLEDGDLIAAYDLKSDRIVWQAAKFVRYDVVDEPLVCIEKEQTSQRLTETHRSLVRSRKRDPFVKLAGELTSGYDLPLSAPWGAPGSMSGPGVVRAALLGWFITEGHARADGRQAHIYQSSSANPDKVDQIRMLLDWSGEPYDERIRNRSDEFPGKGIQHVFVVRDSPLAAWLRDHHKRLPLEYVFQWPEKDARALFDAMVDGDGHRRADGRISFVQKDKELADAFHCLAIRLGYRAITKYRPTHNIYTVYLSVNRWVTLRGPDGKRAPIPRESYTGVVWCPLVDSTFWLARRNGKPFITGNTWPPELLIKPVKAMCPESVCRVCGEPRRRMVGEVAYVNNAGRPARMDMNQPRYAPGVRQFEGYGDNAAHRIAETLGFSDCSHDDWRPGLVLDPFAGSGTTLSVATGHGRDAIGIDLDERNYELALDRVGPLVLELGDIDTLGTID